MALLLFTIVSLIPLFQLLSWRNALCLLFGWLRKSLRKEIAGQLFRIMVDFSSFLSRTEWRGSFLPFDWHIKYINANGLLSYILWVNKVLISNMLDEFLKSQTVFPKQSLLIMLGKDIGVEASLHPLAQTGQVVYASFVLLKIYLTYVWILLIVSIVHLVFNRGLKVKFRAVWILIKYSWLFKRRPLIVFSNALTSLFWCFVAICNWWIYSTLYFGFTFKWAFQKRNTFFKLTSFECLKWIFIVKPFCRLTSLLLVFLCSNIVAQRLILAGP